MRPGRDVVFVGDVHLDRDDADLPAFLHYLQGLASRAGRVVLMGDLFNLWIGAPELEQNHHRAVVLGLRTLRAQGTEVHYLEGNRDYRIAQAYRGDPFDSVSDVGLPEDWGGLSVWAAHGDLVNRRDLQYRTWRWVSRSTPAWWLFSAFPRRRRFAIAESVEKSLLATNRGMKREFPESDVRSYAARHLGVANGVVVLGHFHVERQLVVGPGDQGRVFVLPEWKGSRRHLRLTANGDVSFEDA